MRSASESATYTSSLSTESAARRRKLAFQYKLLLCPVQVSYPFTARCPSRPHQTGTLQTNGDDSSNNNKNIARAWIYHSRRRRSTWPLSNQSLQQPPLQLRAPKGQRATCRESLSSQPVWRLHSLNGLGLAGASTCRRSQCRLWLRSRRACSSMPLINHTSCRTHR
jgi:hypothetical protein